MTDKKVKKPKKKGVQYYGKKLWKLFSEYIRKRDCIEGDFERCKCFTCGVVMPYKRMQAGHYIPRQFKLTKFDERNNNAQCYVCNMLYGGNPAEYHQRLLELYGEDVMDELLELQRKYKIEGCKNMDVDWYKENIEIYRAKVGKLDLPASNCSVEDLPF